MNDTSKKIAKDFRDLAAANPKLAAMLKKLNNGKADYLDADRYALELATALGKALQLNLGDEKLTGDAYREVINEVLPKGLYGIYEDVADYAQTIQQGINERAKVGLRAIKPEFNEAESDAITKKATSVNSYGSIPGGLTNDMQHMAQNVATDTMKTNAKLANDVGYEATVTRIYDRVGVHTQKGGKYRKECRWCLDRCGVDVPYPDAIANDMFRRHPGCGCEIRYTINGKTQVQENWKTNQWVDAELIGTDYQKSELYKSYLRNATPGIGGYAKESGYPSDKTHKRDEETAQWLVNTFGGEYVLINEERSKHNVDCYKVVGDKRVYLEFKRPTTLNAVEKRIRKGTLQLSETDSPDEGVLIIDISGRTVGQKDMVDKIKSEAEKRSKQKVLDIIIRENNNVVDIMRIKK